MAGRSKKIETLKHDAASRKNIPTAEFESVLDPADQEPIRVAFERRNRDLDPQLVWRGKDVPGPAELMAQAPPLFIQEKVHPKVLIDDLERRTQQRRAEGENANGQPDLFADFNGLPSEDARTEFYRHEGNWSNRMILGDSLQVMASLAEREGLRGKVQCIYMDPPYGIRFNSNFQWSTTSRDVKDGKAEHISREPEQVKAFRDTWRDGIHSYLTYLRDRLTVARELLTESGSIFVQIGDENVHRVRALMDEIFGVDNFVSQISFNKSSGLGTVLLPTANDYILWFGKRKESLKFRELKEIKTADEDSIGRYTSALHGDGRVIPLSQVSAGDNSWQVCTYSDLTKPGPGSRYEVQVEGETFTSGQRWWGMTPDSMARAIRSGRIKKTGRSISFIRLLQDSPAVFVYRVKPQCTRAALRPPS